MNEADPRWMRRALELAARGRATTHPNPRVGCVVVRDGAVVGEGWHQVAGGPHAEIHALRMAGDRARGGDAYVTLEPCSHHGRTPPCSEALIAAGVRRVVAAMEDPDPRVSGRGLQRLRDAGIAVELGLESAAAAELNRGFISRMPRTRPWLTLKLAASLDGRTALADGSSRWITGETARADVHKLRAESGAVLTSSATVLADDPQLNVRLDGEWRQPDRIVLDARGRVPVTAAVWAPGARRYALTGPQAPPALQRALAAQGVEALTVECAADGRIVPASALAALAAAEINEVLVECGPRLAGALLRESLIDELHLYLAPRLLGDAARPLLAVPTLEDLSRAPGWRFVSQRLVGEDLCLILRPRS